MRIQINLSEPVQKMPHTDTPEMPHTDTELPDPLPAEPDEIDIDELHFASDYEYMPCMLIEAGVPCKVTRATTKLK